MAMESSILKAYMEFHSVISHSNDQAESLKNCENPSVRWNEILPLIKAKLRDNISQFSENDDDKDTLKHSTDVEINKICDILDSRFDTSPPYTILRLLELIQTPTLNYKRPQKYLNAVKTTIDVNSTFEEIKSEAKISVNNLHMSAPTACATMLTEIPWLKNNKQDKDTEYNSSMNDENANEDVIKPPIDVKDIGNVSNEVLEKIDRVN